MPAGPLLALALAFAGGEPIRAVDEIAVDPKKGSVVVEHRTQVDGKLRAWVEGADFDAVLVAEDAGGARLAEDDDSGGRPAPALDLSATPGAIVRFVVRAKEGGGPARLVTVELAEDDAARAAAADAHARLVAADKGLATGAALEHRAALLALAKELGARDDLATSDALQTTYAYVASQLTSAAEHPATFAASDRLVAIHRVVLPPDSTRRLRTLLMRASALGQLGRAPEAIDEVRAALAVMRRTLDATDEALPPAESTLGNLLFATGDFPGAMSQWEVALRLRERSVPRDLENLAQLHANLAVVAFYLGDLPLAREHVESAREQGAAIVPGSPLDQQIRNARSAIVTEQGDFQAGRALAEESLKLARSSYPPEHVEVAIAELNLALAQVRAGEDAAGRAVLARILAAPPAELAPDHAVIVQARLNLAAIELRLGEFEAADRRLVSIEEQFAGKLPRTHALSRAVSRNRTLALHGLGRVEEAAAIEAELLAATREILPVDHPERIRVELQCATTAARRGRYPEARDAAERTALELQTMLSTRALILSSREAEATARGLGPLLDEALALLLEEHVAAVRPGAEARAFELGETARGLGIAASRSLRAVEAGGARALRDDARSAQIDVVRAARAGDPAALQSAVLRRDATERALRERIASSDAAPRAVSASSVAERLRDGEIAVAWRVWRREPLEGGAEQAASTLIAFLVRRGAPASWVDLGPLEAVESACGAWRRELERAPADRDALRAAGLRVRALVVDPIRARVPDARRWTVVPDGPLLSVPLDALPDPGAPERLLGDELAIRTVWSFEVAPRAVERTGADALVVVGDPDFGAPREGAKPRWPALPATAREIDTIAAIRRSGGDAKTAITVLRGEDASVPRLFERAPSARWLHVATHGAFDRDDAPGGLLTATGDELAQDFARSVRALVPLVRCELVLAGANAADDATMSAEALAALDLRGCDLAVLSACDTGRGEIVGGQGIASFQRALVAAGARDCVTALWRVPDDATHELMSAFYRALWEEHLSPAQALWRAKSALRGRRAPARDWAAWVLASPFGGG